MYQCSPSISRAGDSEASTEKCASVHLHTEGRKKVSCSVVNDSL